ncbi:hypothetical protein [Streptomyces sp. NPDC057302]|uniref:hypothetical protein n=1 Tax=Streptomyces sp. NPDC057302 TaxID=3346094 RepID=UPI0036347948
MTTVPSGFSSSTDIEHHTASHPDRAKPFTPKNVPEPRERPEAEGPLSAKERQLLGKCEYARDHGAMVDWVRGKALDAINKGRLYREGGRTFVQYVEEEWGIGKDDAYRLIAEWPLASAMSQICDKQPPASHVRALADYASTAGVEATAHDYAEAVSRARNAGQKITAQKLRKHLEQSAGAAPELAGVDWARPELAIEPPRVQRVPEPEPAHEQPHARTSGPSLVEPQQDVEDGEIVEDVEDEERADQWQRRINGAVHDAAVRTGRTPVAIAADVERWIERIGR